MIMPKSMTSLIQYRPPGRQQYCFRQVLLYIGSILAAMFFSWVGCYGGMCLYSNFRVLRMIAKKDQVAIMWTCSCRFLMVCMNKSKWLVRLLWLWTPTVMLPPSQNDCPTIWILWLIVQLFAPLEIEAQIKYFCTKPSISRSLSTPQLPGSCRSSCSFLF